MTDSVNAVGSASEVKEATSINSATNTAPKLTDETKAKLKALGVDTTNITSEAQGQIALVQAQAKKEVAHKSKTGENQPQEAIKSEAQSLASELGVTVAKGDSIDTILSNISNAISKLQADAGSDETKLSAVKNYQAKYDSISSSYTSMQASHSKLDKSMSSLASYNKIYQNL